MKNSSENQTDSSDSKVKELTSSGRSQNLGNCKQIFNKDINQRQIIVRQLKMKTPMPHNVALKTSTLQICIKNCNRLLYSAFHRKKFNSSQYFY